VVCRGVITARALSNREIQNNSQPEPLAECKIKKLIICLPAGSYALSKFSLLLASPPTA
jgi:hypothetical protein